MQERWKQDAKDYEQRAAENNYSKEHTKKRIKEIKASLEKNNKA